MCSGLLSNDMERCRRLGILSSRMAEVVEDETGSNSKFIGCRYDVSAVQAFGVTSLLKFELVDAKGTHQFESTSVHGRITSFGKVRKYLLGGKTYQEGN